MVLAAIHSARGATPMVSSGARPHMVPMVWVPWVWLSTGGLLKPPTKSSQHSSAGACRPRQREARAMWLPSTPVSRLATMEPSPLMPRSLHTRRAPMFTRLGMMPMPRTSSAARRSVGSRSSIFMGDSATSTSERAARSRTTSSDLAVTNTPLRIQYGS